MSIFNAITKSAPKATAVLLMSIGSVLVVAPLAAAQQTQADETQVAQSQTGYVLGAEIVEERCNITLADDQDRIFTQVADAALCEQPLVGSRIEYASEITQVRVTPPPETATVLGLTSGDRACYLNLETPLGIINQFASFELCQQDTLIGASVRPIYEERNVLAFSCAGNVACGKTERAILITDLEVLDGGSSTQAPSPSIGDLPDGNYRYWSRDAAERIDEEEMMFAEGILFWFSKRGRNVTGIFGEISGDAICIQGQANEDTVTGIAVRVFPEASVLSAGEEFVDFLPGGRLKIRRGRQLPSDRFLPLEDRQIPINIVRYDSALLDLSGLNRINAGTELPPERCAQS
ncbi:MAG: hypothetical protein AB8B99_13700 [Phormidesmis sp.]